MNIVRGFSTIFQDDFVGGVIVGLVGSLDSTGELLECLRVGSLVDHDVQSLGSILLSSVLKQRFEPSLITTVALDLAVPPRQSPCSLDETF